MSRAKPHVYVAHPITAYGSEHAAARLALVRELLPRAGLINPAELWAGEDEWLDRWPDVLEDLSGLVLFGAADGTVGLGCVTEVCDVLAAGLALAGVGSSGLRRLDGLRFVAERQRSWRRMARPILGPAVDPASFPGGRLGR